MIIRIFILVSVAYHHCRISVLENKTDKNTLISSLGGRRTTLDLLDTDTVIGVTCTIFNVLHGWSRGQKNEQPNNDPSSRKQCSCRLSGSSEYVSVKGAGLLQLYAFKKGVVIDRFWSETGCARSSSFSETG